MTGILQNHRKSDKNVGSKNDHSKLRIKRRAPMLTRKQGAIPKKQI